MEASTHSWQAVYIDGSFDRQGQIARSDVPYEHIHHVTWWPKSNTGQAICMHKRPGHALIWREQPHQRVNGEYLGSDYHLWAASYLLHNCIRQQNVCDAEARGGSVHGIQFDYKLTLTKDGQILRSGSLPVTVQTIEKNGITYTEVI